MWGPGPRPLGGMRSHFPGEKPSLQLQVGRRLEALRVGFLPQRGKLRARLLSVSGATEALCTCGFSGPRARGLFLPSSVGGRSLPVPRDENRPFRGAEAGALFSPTAWRSAGSLSPIHPALTPTGRRVVGWTFVHKGSREAP